MSNIYFIIGAAKDKKKLIAQQNHLSVRWFLCVAYPLFVIILLCSW